MATITLRSDAVTSYQAAVCTVMLITDTSTGQPVNIGQSSWFSLDSAMNAARELSTEKPAPQRAIVLDHNNKFVASWQCGERLPMFVIV